MTEERIRPEALLDPDPVTAADITMREALETIEKEIAGAKKERADLAEDRRRVLEETRLSLAEIVTQDEALRVYIGICEEARGKYRAALGLKADGTPRKQRAKAGGESDQ